MCVRGPRDALSFNEYHNMAAATSGGRVRRELDRAARMHRELSENRRTLERRTGRAFDALSRDGAWLEGSRIEELLASSMNVGERRLHPDAVRLVADTARRSQRGAGMTPPSGEEGAVAKEHIVRAVKMYGEYIKNAQEIDDVFKKFDKNTDGYLSRKELAKMLTNYERNRKRARAVRGVVIELRVTDEDIDWIIEMADSDHSGMINQAEYLPAIAAWEEVAKMKLENQGSPCVIS